MTGNPLVSVIVPVYNAAPFLGECLSSILAQDYSPVEVITVDDGSTDGSATIARSFPNVRCIEQPNSGIAAARNTGIEAAGGEFIAFLDADDVMMPDKLSVQVGHLIAHPDLDCVLARQETVFQPGFDPPPWLRRDRIFGDIDGVQPISAIVRRSVVDRVGGFDPSYQIGEDIDWLLRLRSGGCSVAVLPVILSKRRLHGANQTVINAMDISWYLKAIRSRVHDHRGQVS